jgi:hypothetical protein
MPPLVQRIYRSSLAPSQGDDLRNMRLLGSLRALLFFQACQSTQEASRVHVCFVPAQLQRLYRRVIVSKGGGHEGRAYWQLVLFAVSLGRMIAAAVDILYTPSTDSNHSRMSIFERDTSYTGRRMRKKLLTLLQDLAQPASKQGDMMKVIMIRQESSLRFWSKNSLPIRRPTGVVS